MYEVTNLQEVAAEFERRSLEAKRNSNNPKKKRTEQVQAKGESIAWEQASSFIANLKISPTSS